MFVLKHARFTIKLSNGLLRTSKLKVHRFSCLEISHTINQHKILWRSASIETETLYSKGTHKNSNIYVNIEINKQNWKI